MKTVSELHKLACDAVAEVRRDLKASVFCLFAHRWGVWQTIPSKKAQERRCLNCGKVEINYLYLHCQHDYEIATYGNIVAGNGALVGMYYNLLCKHCGNMKYEAVTASKGISV